FRRAGPGQRPFAEARAARAVAHVENDGGGGPRARRVWPRELRSRGGRWLWLRRRLCDVRRPQSAGPERLFCGAARKNERTASPSLVRKLPVWLEGSLSCSFGATAA